MDETINKLEKEFQLSRENGKPDFKILDQINNLKEQKANLSNSCSMEEGCVSCGS